MKEETLGFQYRHHLGLLVVCQSLAPPLTSALKRSSLFPSGRLQKCRDLARGLAL